MTPEDRAELVFGIDDDDDEIDINDDDPQGYGLLQRDRDLSHYLDFEAH